MTFFHLTGEALWQRMERAVQKIQERLERTAAALEQAGLVFRHVKGVDMFLDTVESKSRDAVYVFFAGERVRPDDVLPNPEVSEAVEVERHRTVSLDALIRMKLTAFQDKDRMHLRDMLDVELLDETWCQRLPAELAARLKLLIDSPNG